MSNVISCLLPGVEFDRGSTGLLGEAERLARQLGTKHIVVAIGAGESILQSCAKQADQVVAVPDSDVADYQPELCLSLLHAACAELEPRVVLLGQDTYSQELTPRLAFRLNGCSIGDAQRIDLHGERFQVTRSVYGGKAVAVIQANLDPAVIWLRARAFATEPERDQHAEILVRPFEPDDKQAGDASATRIVERHQESSSGQRLEDAQVIVSGGRGLGGPEPFEQLRQLAAAMQGELAASRAACDAGWVPPGLQVGQTGKKVAPEFYLAIGISGASQHLMGISDAKVVAAINTDPDAPIFRHCQFGLVEDFRNVVGPLMEAVGSSQ